MYALAKLIDTVVWLYTIVLVVHVVLSWLTAFNVVNSRHPVVNAIGRVTYQLCEPVLRRIRRFLPNLGGLDLSPIVLILVLQFGVNLMWEYLVPAADAMFQPVAAGIRLRLKVAPKAKRNGIGGWLDEPPDGPFGGGKALKVAVTAAPEDGKANAAVIALLAKEWGVAKSAISVVAGATDRRKIVEIRGPSAELIRKIEAWLGSRPE